MRKVRAAVLSATFALLLGSCAANVNRQDLAEEYFNLGNAYFELQDYERSYRYYQRALQVGDALPAAGFNLARLHLERKEERKAMDVLEELLESDPENTLVLETRAYTLYRLGEVDQARREYRRLLERSGGRRRVAYNLGLLEMEADEYEGAVRILEEYLPVAEEDAEYRRLFARALLHTDREDDALDQLEYYRSLIEEEPAALANLGVLYTEWEYYLSALEVFELLPPGVLREREPAWARARAFLLGSGDFDAGATALEEALQAGFDDEAALLALLGTLPDDEAEVLRLLIEEYDIELSGSSDASSEAGE